MLKIGIPKESMLGEGRVALVPDDCRTLLASGCSVYIQTDAGLASGYLDADYTALGVQVLATVNELYRTAELIVKVKQPLEIDLKHLESRHLLFSFLHLAADPGLVNRLCEIGLTAIPFESVSDGEGYPLLAPMSAIAGRLAVLRGSSLLFETEAARGVLLGGVAGTEPGRVVVLGAGVAGSHAVATAVALEAEVHVLDLNASRLSVLAQRLGRIHTHPADADTVAHHCEQADLVIGAVMLAGRRAPVVLSQPSIARMLPGSVIIDIAIDQGGASRVYGRRRRQSPFIASGMCFTQRCPICLVRCRAPPLRRCRQ